MRVKLTDQGRRIPYAMQSYTSIARGSSVKQKGLVDFIITGRWYTLWYSQENVINLLEEFLGVLGILRTNWGTDGPANRGAS